jgi:hypothetical protein
MCARPYASTSRKQHCTPLKYTTASFLQPPTAVGEIEFDAPHWSVFDNALDMAHIHYLHGDSFGNSEKPEIKDMRAERDTWGISGTLR